MDGATGGFFEVLGFVEVLGFGGLVFDVVGVDVLVVEVTVGAASFRDSGDGVVVSRL
ncbi:hypothetical protein LX86_000996 [Lentzea aerocolonigenes]|nr:hypothetical protein [Lentzea aerocolonigenes]